MCQSRSGSTLAFNMLVDTNPCIIRAQHDLLERQRLEESCLIADGEDVSSLCKSAASLNFASNHRVDCPASRSRSRSSTCTSSSDGDTPFNLQPPTAPFQKVHSPALTFPRSISRYPICPAPAFERRQTLYESESPWSWPPSPLFEGPQGWMKQPGMVNMVSSCLGNFMSMR